MRSQRISLEIQFDVEETSLLECIFHNLFSWKCANRIHCANTYKST